MCRSTEIHGFHRIERDRLKITGFYLRLSVLKAGKPLPESLTLVYLPRINGSLLEIDGSKIRPDLPAFVTLHRVILNSGPTGEAVFGSRERVRASEGVRFEVYMREEKVLKGVFRKDEDEEWYMECKCALESELVGIDVSKAEVCVAMEGHVAMSEKVEMVVKKKTTTGRGFGGLEEIPEEREVESELDDDDCSCSCGGEESESVGEDYEEMDMEIEGVRWAVDVGIWVMCLGVGYLVSKASSKSLRRRRFL